MRKQRIELSRRSVLGMGSVLWPIAVFYPSVCLAKFASDEWDFDSLDLFTSESGKWIDPAFAVGVLAVNQADRQISKISMLRDEFELDCDWSITWRKFGEARQAVILAWIDHFFEEDMFFSACVIPKNSWEETNDDRRRQIRSNTESVYRDFSRDDLELILWLTENQKPEQSIMDKELVEELGIFEDVIFLEKERDNKKICNRRGHIKSNDIEQMGSILTKCITFDFRMRNGYVEDFSKKIFGQHKSYVDRLKHHLNVDSLSDQSLQDHDKFQVKMV